MLTISETEFDRIWMYAARSVGAGSASGSAASGSDFGAHRRVIAGRLCLRGTTATDIAWRVIRADPERRIMLAMGLHRRQQCSAAGMIGGKYNLT
jgi:hypothetical protein